MEGCFGNVQNVPRLLFFPLQKIACHAIYPLVSRQVGVVKKEKSVQTGQVAFLMGRSKRVLLRLTSLSVIFMVKKKKKKKIPDPSLFTLGIPSTMSFICRIPSMYLPIMSFAIFISYVVNAISGGAFFVLLCSEFCRRTIVTYNERGLLLNIN